MKTFGLSRDVPVVLGATAFRIIDVQAYIARGGGRYAGLAPAAVEAQHGYFFHEMESRAVPNMQRLQTACRASGIEVLYTVIESLTDDGREMSLDDKISTLFCPRGSADARVIAELAPRGDEMVFPKTAASVFISTTIDYVLRNLGVRHLIIAGALTDQAIDCAVRDACALGYLVTVAVDACAAESADRHRSALSNSRGSCRQITTEALRAEIAALTP